jgi:predicted RNA-binding Zn-ribbon protein involved in translation (DUF1610 family)
MSDTAVTIRDATCRACGTRFRTGAQAPSCPRCNSGAIELGSATSVAVPAPVPAGVVPQPEEVAAQVAAQLPNTAQLSYRCPVCGWATSWPAVAEAPATITAHEKTHAADLLI